MEHLFFKCNIFSFSSNVRFHGASGHHAMAMTGGTSKLKDGYIHIGLIFRGLVKESSLVCNYLVHLAVLWRNQKIFKDEADSWERVLELIKLKSFYWCKTTLCPDLVQDKLQQ
ncbi:hypothetical protein SLA2020_473960 [Shorea laevis]